MPVENIPEIIMSALCIGTALVAYLFLWLIFGKDPKKGTVIPIFEPPANLSPAQMRFMHTMKADQKCFLSALLSCANKGFLKIAGPDHQTKKFSIEKINNNYNDLTSEEKSIGYALFSSNSKVTMDLKDIMAIKNAKKSFGSALRLEIEKGGKFFTKNIAISTIGAFISLCCFSPILMLWQRHAGYYFLGDLASLVCRALMVGFFLFLVIKIGKTKSFTLALVTFAVGVYPLIYVFSTFKYMAEIVPLYIYFSIALILIMNAIFISLMPKRTKLGASLKDSIEGFKMYLETAEKDLLNYATPPEKTPELFEKYLPYALALDVENAWGSKFDVAFDILGVENIISTKHRRQWR